MDWNILKNILKTRTGRFRWFDIALLLCVALTVWEFVGPGSPSQLSSLVKPPVLALKRNRTLPLPGVKWEEKKEHIVIAMGSTCLSCVQSIDFYKSISRLVGERRAEFSFLALSLDEKNTIQKWLDTHGIRAKLVLVNPISVGVTTTPTLMFVNGGGLVTDIVVGKATKEQETVILERIAGTRTSGYLDNQEEYFAKQNVGIGTPINQDEFDKLLMTSNPVLLDSRERNLYKSHHQKNAINIPMDELAVRARAELPASRPIVVDCTLGSDVDCIASSQSLLGQGFEQVYLLGL